METFIIELNYEEAKSLVYATRRMASRLGGVAGVFGMRNA